MKHCTQTQRQVYSAEEDLAQKFVEDNPMLFVNSMLVRAKHHALINQLNEWLHHA